MNFSIKKIPGLKKAIRLSRNLAVILLTLVLLTLAVWEFKYLIFETTYFELKKIAIEGNYTVDKETIVKLSEFKLAQNFFKLNYARAQERIKMCPKIKNVEIITEGLGEVLIKVSEREPVILVLSNKKFYEIDREGYILSITDRCVKFDLPILNGIKVLPELKLGDSVASDGKIKSVINWITNLESSYLTSISEVSLEGSEIILITNDGIKIYPGNSMNYRENFEFLNIVCDKFKKDGIQLSYVDMRFNGEIVVKPINN